ncbi:sigma-54 dependent transcriptional regulator [Brenneria populi subsp. brevivirga]|uniref:sigma-54-dependent transcriptional regulator n=1 Tax=Brenneria populi TaxID=1505588 RepID=UPI002E178D2A|nr:sigma-54 dependent transcriptional regulator [Brenneria populi subsp. brevivirga]
MNQSRVNVKIIYVEDSPDVRFACEQTMQLAGYDVISVETGEQGLLMINREPDSILVTDVRLPNMSGLDLMKRVLLLDSSIPVILITGHGDVEMAVKAMREGAYDFIEKPCNAEKLLDVIERAMEKRRLIVENRLLRLRLRQEKGPLLIGRSHGMNQLREALANVADTCADVLIQGETGCGKEVVARTLHHWSQCRSGNFVALNCAALPEPLFESEIFGHEPGAFTGAVKRRIGKIEHASGGTLFLDEIEGMPLGMQSKLLRVLQERTIERLGANQQIPVNSRVVAATKDDLLMLSKEGRFRPDLYYRLNVVTIRIPPLRERREDIPELFYWFSNQAAQTYHRPMPDVSPMLLAWLQAQSWPGNVRELKHSAERFVLGILNSPDEIPLTKQDELGLTASIDAFEKKLIEDMLRQTGGQVSLTARQLMLPRKTLYDKLNRHNITPQDFRFTESSNRPDRRFDGAGRG